MFSKVPRFQHLESHGPQRVIDGREVVDGGQATAQLDVGLEPTVVRIIRVVAVGHAVFVRGEAGAGLQQAKDLAVDAGLIRRMAGRLDVEYRVE